MKPIYTTQLFLATALLFVLCSCHYYKVAATLQPENTVTTAKLDSLRSGNRYLILRNGLSDAYRITNMQISEDRTNALLSLQPVDREHKYHFQQGAYTSRQYQRSNALQSGVINEAHLYIPYDKEAATGTYTLPLSKVERIEVLQNDAKRTANSYVLSGLGIAVGLFAIATIVVLSSIRFD
jgi:hypothetical protein